jgi:hypothetical protein
MRVGASHGGGGGFSFLRKMVTSVMDLMGRSACWASAREAELGACWASAREAELQMVLTGQANRMNEGGVLGLKID